MYIQVLMGVPGKVAEAEDRGSFDVEQLGEGAKRPMVRIRGSAISEAFVRGLDIPLMPPYKISKD